MNTFHNTVTVLQRLILKQMRQSIVPKCLIVRHCMINSIVSLISLKCFSLQTLLKLILIIHGKYVHVDEISDSIVGMQFIVICHQFNLTGICHYVMTVFLCKVLYISVVPNLFVPCFFLPASRYASPGIGHHHVSVCPSVAPVLYQNG